MPQASPNIVQSASEGGTGAKFRRLRAGPERELLEVFLGSALPFHVPRGCRLTLFREPRLDSGFPDIVLVVYHEATMRRWDRSRANLRPSDLRLLQLLIELGPRDQDDLQRVWKKLPVASLERLEGAALVRRVGSRWAARSIQQSFAVRSLIAIEAKVNDWKSAVQQAYLNTWFTSESYVLMPPAAKGHPLFAAARKRGVGVLSTAEGVLRKPRKSACLPRSYASWLFNEWAWRASLKDVG
jgi:hypothetical protein